MILRNQYTSQISSLLKKIAVLLILYTFSRLLFFVFNSSYFQDVTSIELIKIFIFGVRFDYASIIQFNLLFIVLYLLPFSFAARQSYRRGLFISFWVVNALLLLTNFCDIEYFKYTSKRTTADIFKYTLLSDDVFKLLPQFLLDFWYIPLLWILTIGFGIWFTRSKKLDIDNHYQFKFWNFTAMILLTGALFFSARGFGMKPLRIISAARYASSQDIPLLINTPFSILHTIQEKNNIERKYFSDNTYTKIFSPLRQYKAFQKRNDNVVIIILESFSHEFIGTLSGKKTYTPFLDSLLNESLTFENGFANCRKSIEGIPAILAGLPSLTNNSYISSHYGGNRLEALPFILDKHGYSTAFFHGGRNGTMGFDEFSKVAGIKNYYGMDEYNGPEAFDGNWGIYDDEFFQYSISEMNIMSKPFFSAIFTLSSHHPYHFPERYNQMILSNEEAQLRAIRYTDISLRHFFENARKQDWFKNTLFVIVADHTAKVIDQEYNNPVGTFRIPIAFYQPGNESLKGRRKDIAQQTDIMPSVLHFLGIEDHFLAYGSSIFSEERKPYAINYLNNIYYYFEEDCILSFDGEITLSLFDYSNDKKLLRNLKSQNKDTILRLEKNLKATIQDYLGRLETNKLLYNLK